MATLHETAYTRLKPDPTAYASGDVTLNRAWIPPLYLTWD